jgi:hypothetical protein
MKTIMTAAMLLALATTAQAFQLSCTHTGGVQTVTVNGKTTTRRDDYQYTTTVDVDLAARTLTLEGGSGGDITQVTGAEIVAGESWTLSGTTHSNAWRLNRVTGELTWHEQFTGNTSPSVHDSYLKCELAKAKF